MDGTFTTMPMDEMTRTRDVIKFMCKKHGLYNESEWGLIEQWDHAGLPRRHVGAEGAFGRAHDGRHHHLC